MNINSPIRLVAAVCCALGAAALAFYVWRPTRARVLGDGAAVATPAVTEMPAETPELTDDYETSYDVTIQGLSPEETSLVVSEAVLGAISGSASALPAESRVKDLARSVGEYLGSHVASTAEQLFQQFTALDISKPEIANNPKFPVYFQRAGDLLRAGRLRSSGILVRAQVLAGANVTPPPDPQVGSIATMRRDAGRPALEALPLAERNEYEVVLPMILRTIDGVGFEGKIGLVFAWEPRSKRWVPVASRIYGAPQGRPTSLLIM